MAPSSSKLPALLLILLGCSLGTASVAAETKRQEPINLDAASSEVDYKTNTVVFKDIVISQGDTKVQAERAHAIGATNNMFENSRWTFEGNVRIKAEQRGNLHSDQAVVDFRKNRISKATITGTPAEFEQKRSDTEQMARGRADEIIYDVSEGTVRLAKAPTDNKSGSDAWLSDGLNEISSPLIVYNIREQRVEATPPENTGGRVHFTIAPPKKPDSDKTDANKAPGASGPGKSQSNSAEPGKSGTAKGAANSSGSLSE